MSDSTRPRQPKKKSAKLLKLDAQIGALQREREDEIKRLNKQERDNDTRRKILAGQAVLKQALRDESFKKFLYELLNKDLRQQYNRDVFDDLMEEWGMPPLPRLQPAPAPSPAEMANENIPEMEGQ